MYYDPGMGLRRDRVDPLAVGRDYPVYGVTGFIGGLWVYVEDDVDSQYPTWYPLVLFGVVDARLPAERVFSSGELSARGIGQNWILSWPQWALSDDFFYERLVDGEARAIAQFEIWRRELGA